MKFTDQFRTGWRNLSRQKLRTSLTIFAIVIGAVSVTVMLSLVTSAKSFLVSSAQKTGMDKRVIVTGTPGLSYRESTWNWPDGSGKEIQLRAPDVLIIHVPSGIDPKDVWWEIADPIAAFKLEVAGTIGMDRRPRRGP